MVLDKELTVLMGEELLLRGTIEEDSQEIKQLSAKLELLQQKQVLDVQNLSMIQFKIENLKSTKT